VLSGAGAFHGECPVDDALVERFASSRSASFSRRTRISQVEVAVATWPKSGIGIEAREMSFEVSTMHSVSREIGTHTSVETAREPGRSCRQAK